MRLKFGLGLSGVLKLKSGSFVGGLQMLKDAFYVVVGLDHFLVVAAALFVGASLDELAHDPIQVPFSLLFLLALYDLSKFQNEGNV